MRVQDGVLAAKALGAKRRAAAVAAVLATNWRRVSGDRIGQALVLLARIDGGSRQAGYMRGVAANVDAL